MFDKLVPWNILPERKVYIGNTKQLDKATESMNKATERIRAQREHIAELQDLDERNRQQYEQLVNWTRELEVRNEALFNGVEEYLEGKNIEEKNVLSMLVQNHKEKAYNKKEKEGVIIERNEFLI